MTAEQFQVRYHDYRTRDRTAALIESMKLRLTDGAVVAVQIGDEFTLMLDTAAKAAAEMGLASIVTPNDIRTPAPATEGRNEREQIPAPD